MRVEHLGKSASIDEVLEMTVSEALDFFKGLRDVQTELAPLGDVGLEYVRLGQPVPTLSGGEAQRLKLAGHLAEAARSGISTAKVAKKGSLFLFDEPTTGLHFDDVARLMRAFRKLLAAGHTLLVIEHNLDVIRAADWLIDLGPEGGDAGGLVIGAGTPQDLMDNPKSHTGAALRDYETSILPTPVADVVVSSDIDAQEAEQAGLSAHRRAGRALWRRRRHAAAIADARAPPERHVHRDPQRARAQPEERQRRDPARQVHRDHRRVRLRSPRWPSTSSSTKASAATWNRSTPTPAPSCSLPASQTWTPSSASRPRSPSSSAPAAADASPPWPR